jgi:hypothetical protein
MSERTDQIQKKSADMALDATAAVFGLDKGVVAKVLQVGIPMQMKLLQNNPELAKKMYTASFSILPEQVQDFYKNLANDGKLAEVSREEYRSMFGASAQAINEAAAEAGELSAEDVEGVMAASLPSLKALLREAAESSHVDEKGFGDWLKRDAA